MDSKNRCEAKIEFYCDAYCNEDDRDPCRFRVEDEKRLGDCEHLCGVKCISNDAREDALRRFFRKNMANTELMSWLAALPAEDWSKEYERATPVRWDPVKGWVDG